MQNSKRKRSKSKQHHRNKDTKGREDGTEKVSLESQEVNDCQLNGCAKDTFPGKYASEKSKNPHEEKSWEYKNRREARPEIAGQCLYVKISLISTIVIQPGFKYFNICF